MLNGNLYEYLFKGMINGFAHCRAIYDDKSEMVDWIYVKVNPAFEVQTGLKDLEGRSASLATRQFLNKTTNLVRRFEMVAQGGKNQRFEMYIDALNAWFSMSVYSVEEHTFSLVLENISDRKEAAKRLSLANEEILMAFVGSLEFRDKPTEEHAIRVTEIAVNFGKLLMMTDNELDNLRRGSLLHDIGKLGIPDTILLKQGALTKDEYAIMKKHSQYAFDVLWPIKYLRPAIDVPYCHHEKWDGSGYPRGLQGNKIPLSARLFSIVDVYDALTTDRSYRPAMSRAKAIKFIQDKSGSHFDPDLVTFFLAKVESLLDW